MGVYHGGKTVPHNHYQLQLMLIIILLMKSYTLSLLNFMFGYVNSN